MAVGHAGSCARAKVQGFLVTDYMPRFGEALPEMAGWLRAKANSSIAKISSRV